MYIVKDIISKVVRYTSIILEIQGRNVTFITEIEEEDEFYVSVTCESDKDYLKLVFDDVDYYDNTSTLKDCQLQDELFDIIIGQINDGEID